MTIETIRTAIEDSAVDRYFVTEFTHDGGGFALPGLEIYWDDQDPSNTGWAYREARAFDPETGEWDGDESGSLEDADLGSLLARAAARAVLLDASDASGGAL